MTVEHYCGTGVVLTLVGIACVVTNMVIVLGQHVHVWVLRTLLVLCTLCIGHGLRLGDVAVHRTHSDRCKHMSTAAIVTGGVGYLSIYWNGIASGG